MIQLIGWLIMMATLGAIETHLAVIQQIITAGRP